MLKRERILRNNITIPSFFFFLANLEELVIWRLLLLHLLSTFVSCVSCGEYNDVIGDLIPSEVKLLVCACETAFVLSNMNSSTSPYQRHFSRSIRIKLHIDSLVFFINHYKWNSISFDKPRCPYQSQGIVPPNWYAPSTNYLHLEHK
jgi:hypothetical protein